MNSGVILIMWFGMFTFSLVYPETLSSPLTLSPDDTLKLSLNIQEKDNDKGFHPHQALLTLTDEKTREQQYLLVIKVREKGKARVELVSRSSDCNEPLPCFLYYISYSYIL